MIGLHNSCRQFLEMKKDFYNKTSKVMTMYDDK